MSAAEVPSPEVVFRNAGFVVRKPNPIQALYRQKAALETLVRKLYREGADEAEIRPYAQQLQDVKARIPVNRPVVR